MALFFGVNSRVKDFSFANIFWRKFSLRLMVLLLVSSIILFLGQSIASSFCNQTISSELTSASLQLAQLVDSDLSESKLKHEANVILAKTWDKINENGFVVDSSLSFYNIESKGLVANSFEVPIVNSNDLIWWWKDKTKNETGTPTLSLSDEMTEFYYQHKNNSVYIMKTFCINNVLRPTMIVARDENGNDIGSCSSAVPSIETTEYANPVEVDIIGNRINDKVYGAMVNFTINEASASENIEAEQEVASDVITIAYDTISNDGQVQIVSNRFIINQTKYQVDCGFQSDFWSGAWRYVLLFEIAGALACAIFAFINTKETLDIYQ